LITTAVSLVGAAGSVLAVHRMWRVSPPALSVMRSLVVSVVVFAAARALVQNGRNLTTLALLAPLALLGALIPVLFVLTGELGRRELELVQPRRA
jgi:hypothetical protein